MVIPQICTALASRYAGLAVAFFVFAGTADAATVYEELVFGDFSNDNENPTLLPLQFSEGSNVISGGASNSDEDYFTTTIAPGYLLEQVILISRSPSPNNFVSFLGVYKGPTYAQTANFYAWGYAFYTDADAGTDLLPEIAASKGNFSGPMGPGDYSFRFDSAQLASELYKVDFRVAAGWVPEPGSGVLACLAMAIFAKRPRRRLR